MRRGAALLALVAASVQGADAPTVTEPRAWRHELSVHDAAVDFRAGTCRGGRVSGSSPGAQASPAPASPPGVLLDGEGLAPGDVAEYESPALEGSRPFHEALVSWNVDCPLGRGFWVEVRVARRDGPWSPWLFIDDWGRVDPPPERTTRFDGGSIDVDFFRSDSVWDRIQYRVRARVPAPRDKTKADRTEAGGAVRDGTGGLASMLDIAPWPIRIARMAVTLSERGAPIGGETARGSFSGQGETEPASVRRLPVPARSQKTEDPEISGRICSPTSVAMVIEYRGVKRPTAEVAARAHDPAHDIYGNWPRNVQAAWTLGVPGYLARFPDWDAVRRSIAAGQPLVVSIRASKGELTGAPYPSTEGHLLVLAGFGDDGSVLVNDPAAPNAETVARSYGREEIERVWLGRGGTAYVLLPREGSPAR